MSNVYEVMRAASLTSSQDYSADKLALNIRPSDVYLAASLGRIPGWSVVNRQGRNTDVTSGGVPEDIWNGGGVYTGFPTGSAETVQVFSSSANDTSAGSGARTVRLEGLDANFIEISEVVTLNGTTAVTTTNLWKRVNRLIVLTSGSSNTAFAAGTITVRHSTTTANVFIAAAAGINQSQVSAYTIPAGKTGLLVRYNIDVSRISTANIDGGLWYREFGAAPRMRRLFTASDTDSHHVTYSAPLVLPEKTDIVVRVTTASATCEVVANYDIILVSN